MAATETGIAVGPELDKPYEPSQVEPRWAREWEQRGYFHAQDVSDRPPYCIVLPPPNVTGSLHLGHALTATIEDALTRWKRMSGFNALWQPGIDHAGIATQLVVERELLRTERKSRHDLGRAEFIRRVWQWKDQYGSRIAQQHRALGASLDWERERFTMDEHSSRAVREAFVRLYQEGLLYRSERLIHWCVKDRTALSDLEVEHEEHAQAELYKFAYPLADGSGEIVVATTRPETMLGDTAVAVHPDDPRYKAMIGKLVKHPLLDRTIPIIADAELVDPKFGTGAVKVTPAHSFEDFEAGKRNRLPMINILNLDGTLNENAGRFKGQDRIAARPAIKAALKELGLERGSEMHHLALGRCQRCEGVVEPLLSKQWFVKTKPLADPVIEAVEAGRIRFVPEQWKAELFRWLRNIHDWCVSRQLWWGHQIPAWYCEYGHVTVARETPRECETCHSGRLTQDPDVLDTWFSSGLWPFSTLGWPDDTPALRTFYPNSVMETGFDILFFWVARMAMLGLHFTGEVPFRVVFLHAMVRDKHGEKMSKTRGNVIDPLDLTAKYGADALRFTLASMAGQGRDIKLDEKRIEGYRAFANKIWNAARFVLRSADGYDPDRPAPPASVYDRWILSRFQRCADETRQAMEELRLNDAANGIYRFVWGELCDWAIELSKPALYGDRSPAERAGTQAALLQSLEGALRLLHPFMPFVTEEVWQRLPKRSFHAPSIMIERYPAPDSLLDPRAEAEMDALVRAIDGARSLRGEVNLPPNQAVPLVLVPRDGAAQRLFEAHRQAFSRLANASEVQVLAPGAPRPRQAAAHVEPEVEVHLPLKGLIDFAAEKARVTKELAGRSGREGPRPRGRAGRETGQADAPPGSRHESGGWNERAEEREQRRLGRREARAGAPQHGPDGHARRARRARTRRRRRVAVRRRSGRLRRFAGGRPAWLVLSGRRRREHRDAGAFPDEEPRPRTDGKGRRRAGDRRAERRGEAAGDGEGRGQAAGAVDQASQAVPAEARGEEGSRTRQGRPEGGRQGGRQVQAEEGDPARGREIEPPLRQGQEEGRRQEGRQGSPLAAVAAADRAALRCSWRGVSG